MQIKYRDNLELILNCDRDRRTVCQHQYTSYPLRLSTPFYLEGKGTNRAYHYLINTSPGLLAGDELNLSLQLEANTSLYLTDQAATKVHQMPEIDTKATVNYQIKLEPNSSLELVSEPVILYKDAALSQKTLIQIHPTAKLFTSEIILPGRLAKNEYYDFKYYRNRLKVTDSSNKLLFIDSTLLEGQQNRFKNNKLFASLPIIGSATAILPNTELNLLVAQLNNLEIAESNLETATTILPNQTGVLIRALSNKTSIIKQHFTRTLNCIRSINNQHSLPHIPK